MTRFLYSTLMRLSVPLVLLRLLWRSRKNPGYRKDLGQRLGFGLGAPREGPGLIWIHAVSVGETLAVAPLIESLIEQMGAGRLLITSTTPTGAAQVQRLFGDRVLRSWFPIDTPGAVRRHLAHWQPKSLVLVETEIWPNLILACQQRHCPVLLLNARLSARSARGYSRLGRFSRQTISALSVIACQSSADARRFRSLSYNPARISVAGSIKYDLDVEGLRDERDKLAAILNPEGKRWLMVAASTHPGEEGPVVDAYQTLRQFRGNALLVLAPRHPERCEKIADRLRRDGLQCVRRSQGRRVADRDDVVLLDTLGELALVQGLAQLVFVGGSLVPRGGHNPLEAAAWGVPVVTGRQVHNFSAIYRDLADAGGAIMLSARETLEARISVLAGDDDQLMRIGEAGKQLVATKRGALALQRTLILDYSD